MPLQRSWIKEFSKPADTNEKLMEEIMILKRVFLILALIQPLSLPAYAFLGEANLVFQYQNIVAKMVDLINAQNVNELGQMVADKETEAMLRKESPALQPVVIDKVLTTLNCADNYHVDRNNILTVIDYSLPSSQKRLWVFDLKTKKLLYHTYVSHGIKSGSLISNYFSNKNNSKASSIGIYKTEKTYYGRDGFSLRLEGLEKGFNHNAFNRYIVMHGGWYVDENFIKKYGRPGRSWGCPAIPLNETEGIINTIKDSSLFVAYYPSNEWFAKSKFLTCESLAASSNNAPDLTAVPDDMRGKILFADINKNNSREENEPVVVITADDYMRFFPHQPPLERMLRRQINKMEYIVLNESEFDVIIKTHNEPVVSFVIPEVKMQRGYYATMMKVVSLGKIKGIHSNNVLSYSDGFAVELQEKPTVQLKTTEVFIRWLGL